MPPRRKTTKFKGQIPNELVHFIVEELDALLVKVPDRRRTGCNIARVCKSWMKFGYALAWKKRIFALRLKKDILGGVVKHLKASPTAAAAVEELTIDGPGKNSFWPREGGLEDLFRMCINLTNLTVDAAASRAITLLDAVLSTGNDRLTHLKISTCGHHEEPFSPVDLIRIISSFPALTSLVILVMFPASLDAPLPVAPAPLPVLQLSHLTVNLSNEWGNSLPHLRDAFFKSLLPMLNPTALESCHNDLLTRDTALYDWLPQCTNLQDLHLMCFAGQGPDEVADVTKILTALSTYNKLRHFLLLFGFADHGIVPLAARQALLDAAPTSLETFSCGIPLKPDSPPLTTFLESRLDSALRTFRTAYLKRNEQGEAVWLSTDQRAFNFVSLKKVEGEEGERKWIETDRQNSWPHSTP
ncbi:hypothetical protein JCM11641_008439 [Rhodosporidiobolus odoratus]